MSAELKAKVTEDYYPDENGKKGKLLVLRVTAEDLEGKQLTTIPYFDDKALRFIIKSDKEITYVPIGDGDEDVITDR